MSVDVICVHVTYDKAPFCRYYSDIRPEEQMDTGCYTSDSDVEMTSETEYDPYDEFIIVHHFGPMDLIALKELPVKEEEDDKFPIYKCPARLEYERYTLNALEYRKNELIHQLEMALSNDDIIYYTCDA